MVSCFWWELAVFLFLLLPLGSNEQHQSECLSYALSASMFGQKVPIYNKLAGNNKSREKSKHPPRLRDSAVINGLGIENRITFILPYIY